MAIGNSDGVSLTVSVTTRVVDSASFDVCEATVVSLFPIVKNSRSASASLDASDSVTMSPVETTIDSVYFAVPVDDSDSVEVSKSNAIITDVDISVVTISSVEVSGRVVRSGSAGVVESIQYTVCRMAEVRKKLMKVRLIVIVIIREFLIALSFPISLGYA